MDKNILKQWILESLSSRLVEKKDWEGAPEVKSSGSAGRPSAYGEKTKKSQQQPKAKKLTPDQEAARSAAKGGEKEGDSAELAKMKYDAHTDYEEKSSGSPRRPEDATPAEAAKTHAEIRAGKDKKTGRKRRSDAKAPPPEVVKAKADRDAKRAETFSQPTGGEHLKHLFISKKPTGDLRTDVQNRLLRSGAVERHSHTGDLVYTRGEKAGHRVSGRLGQLLSTGKKPARPKKVPEAGKNITLKQTGKSSRGRKPGEPEPEIQAAARPMTSDERMAHMKKVLPRIKAEVKAKKSAEALSKKQKKKS